MDPQLELDSEFGLGTKPCPDCGSTSVRLCIRQWMHCTRPSDLEGRNPVGFTRVGRYWRWDFAKRDEQQ